MKSYFQNTDNLTDLRQQYKQLAKKLHPDTGGTAASFAEMKKEYEEKEKELHTSRKKLQKALLSIVNSPFFDDYILPGLQKSRSRYSKMLFDNEKLLKIFVDDPDQQELYAELLQEQLENFDIKQFLLKILN